MSTFSTKTIINASANDVWQALADIGNIAVWNPGVTESYVNTDQTEGIGAGRRCELGGKNYLDESVVDWEEGKRLTMRIIDTNLPFKTADIRFTLREGDGATEVTLSPDYELKYGLFGTLLDKVMVRRTYQQGMDALLAGLKHHVELS